MAAILVVDDRAINREFLVNLLGYYGHTLFEAGDGNEALTAVAAFKPDLVISDILMPNMDGEEFVRRLRADPVLKDMPVIFYTATYRVLAARTIADRVNVSWVLPKPSEPKTIIETIAKALGVRVPAPIAPVAKPQAAPAVAAPKRGPGAPGKGFGEQISAVEGLTLRLNKILEDALKITNEQAVSLADVRLLEGALHEVQSLGLRLTGLIELGQEVVLLRDPIALIAMFCRAIQDIMSARYAGVVILDAKDRTLRQFAALGLDVETRAQVAAEITRCPAQEQVFAAGRPLRLEAGGGTCVSGLPQTHPPVQSFIACPIVALGRTHGWMYLADRLGDKGFTLEDERIASTLATQLALTWENITLQGDLEQQIARRRETEARYRYLLNSSPSVIYATDPDSGRCTYVSDTLALLTGYEPQAMLGEPDFWSAHVHPDDIERIMSELQRRKKKGEGSIEYRFRRKDGEYRWIRDTFRIIPAAAGGQPAELVGSWTDITASRRIEEQLAQSLKMEAVGQLTGGVAHDFNNRLTVIIGNLELMQRTLGKDPALESQFKSMLSAADGAADLTRKLLAFSSQQVLEPTVVNINDLIGGMRDMLVRTLGESVKIVFSPGPDLWLVHADRTLIENMLLNLAVNARDAMPHGGELTIETANKVLAEPYSESHGRGVEGDFVLLSVSDTGEGMSAEVKRRVFEPFFTTKPAGKGTGLGLAMVYGFVDQSGGHIDIYSEPGHGTTFKIYFPKNVSDEGASVAVPKKKVLEKKTGDEGAITRGKVILLVEDDNAVRKLSTLLLKEMECQVLTADSGPAALKLFASQPAIDLLFTDMIMPDGMTGVQLAAKLRERLPDLRVLYTSGYAPQAAADRRTIEHPNDFWLAKPYRSQALKEALCRALGAQT